MQRGAEGEGEGRLGVRESGGTGQGEGSGGV